MGNHFKWVSDEKGKKSIKKTGIPISLQRRLIQKGGRTSQVFHFFLLFPENIFENTQAKGLETGLREEHGGRRHAQRPRGFWGKKTQLFMTRWGEIGNRTLVVFLPGRWNLGFLFASASVASCYRWCRGLGKDVQIHTRRRSFFSLCACPWPAYFS